MTLSALLAFDCEPRHTMRVVGKVIKLWVFGPGELWRTRQSVLHDFG